MNNEIIMTTQIINTLDKEGIRPWLDKLYTPPPDSHKGQNGRVLVIGGSHLFHSASLWAAEIISHFADMVHYSSTVENGEIFLSLKKKFHNGIIVKKKDIPYYVTEDDCVLVGNGMVRGEEMTDILPLLSDFNQVMQIESESLYTAQLVNYLIHAFPHKKFVFDAGALQMMNREWLLSLQTPPILTPHMLEFQRLFGIDLHNLNSEDRQKYIQECAQRYHCVILCKTGEDIITDGNNIYTITGGNAGLTKGGTGDILAGLVASLYAKNDAITASITASYILKKTADNLFLTKGYWYNNEDIIPTIPLVLRQLKIDLE